jgi:hypothetical protein
MLSLATDYGGSDKLCACSPVMLGAPPRDGLPFDAALAIGILQHSHDLVLLMGLLRTALNPSAGLFVLNNTNRAAPINELSWVNDLFDVKTDLQKLVCHRPGMRAPAKCNCARPDGPSFRKTLRTVNVERACGRRRPALVLSASIVW